jgi:uncharacterized protein (TIGR02246 family)
MKSHLFLFFFLSIFIISACDQTTQTSTTPSDEELSQSLEKDKSAILEIIADYEKALEQRDPSACASMFASNGIFLPNGSETVSGDGILENFKSTLADFPTSWSIDLKVQEIDVHYDWAYARTENSIAYTQDGQSENLRSRSIFLFARQDDGAWKVKTYAFNAIENNDGQ